MPIAPGARMRIPDSTSPEAFERYVSGKVLRASRGDAWREVKAWIISLPRASGGVAMPAVSEPFLAMTLSGQAEFEERENQGPWISHQLKKGSLFLTTGGAPYECRWRTLGTEPFESLLVFIALPLLRHAMEENFGAGAGRARLKDLSAFTDATLETLLEQLREELMRRKASPLFVQGVGQAIAIHLARSYADTSAGAQSAGPALPGFKLRQITDWIAAHVTEELNLTRLAAQAGLSKFHFHRLFKNATSVSPARYQTRLRMDAARRLLRETKKSVVAIAIDVGYTSPSHFAQLFRRETGLSPSEYRRQR